MTDLNEHTTKNTDWFSHFSNDKRKKLVLGAVIIVLALLSLGFIAQRSLPGGVFYDLKTRVIENLNESAQASKESKANYQTTRMEARLEELKALTEKGSLSAEAQEDLRALTTLHTQTLKKAVALQADEVPTPAMLRAISNFSDVAAAMETISEREEFLQELGEHMEDVRREAVNLYQEQSDRYVERETPENIFELVRTLLSDVSNEINNAGISDDTIDDAEVYISRVGPALAAGDYPRALTAVAEAKRFIMIEKYGALKISEDTANTNSEATSTEADKATSTESASPTSTPEVPTPQTPQGSFGFPN